MNIFNSKHINFLSQELLNNLHLKLEGQNTNEALQIKSYLSSLKALFKQTNKFSDKGVNRRWTLIKSNSTHSKATNNAIYKIGLIQEQLKILILLHLFKCNKICLKPEFLKKLQKFVGFNQAPRNSNSLSLLSDNQQHLIKEVSDALLKIDPIKLIPLLDTKILSLNTVIQGKLFWHLGLDKRCLPLLNWILKHLNEVDINAQDISTGKTFLQTCKLPSDYKLARQLILKGANPDHIDLTKLFFCMMKITWSAYDEKLFQILKEKIKTLRPLVIIQWLNLYKEKHPSKFDSILKSFNLTSIQFNWADDFIYIWKDYEKEADPLTRSNYIDQLSALANSLSNSSLNLNSLFQQIQADHEKNIEEAQILLSTFDKNKHYPRTALRYAIMFCLVNGDYETLEDLIHCHQIDLLNPSKIVHHFLLDKTWMQEHIKNPFELNYNGSLLRIQAAVLSKNLRKMIETSNSILPKNIHKQIFKIINDCCHSLNLATYLGNLVSREGSQSAENVIVESIKNVSFPVLIPCGSKTHSTSVCVEKTGPGKVRLKLYNTGYGISKYHYWLSNNHYQTCRVIEDVPIANVLDPDNWKKIIDSKDKEDISYLYDVFDNHLGKNGHLLPASKNPFDYEQKQMHGTCSAQNLMSFTRDQFLEKIPGSDFEKMGIYKFIKAGTLTEIGNYTAGSDKQIKRLAKLKLSKHVQELALTKLVDDRLFPKIHQQLSHLFEKVGNGIQVDLSQLGSFGSRYHFLRTSCQDLAKKGLEGDLNHKTLEKLPEIRDYVTSVYLDKFFSISNIKNLLNEYEIIGDWAELAKTLGKILRSTPYSFVAIEWLMKAENIDAAKKVLPELVKHLNTSHEKVLENLQATFILKSRIDLIELMTTQ